MLGVESLDESLSHPLVFQIMGYMATHQKDRVQIMGFFMKSKKLEMGRSLGYNMDGCFDRVKEIVPGHMKNNVEI